MGEILQTPKELETQGYVVTDTNNVTGMTGLLVPLRMGLEPMQGTVTVMSEDIDGEDFLAIRELIAEQPTATENGAYRLRLQIYCGTEDKLRGVPDFYGLDCLAALVSLLDSEDVKVEWD